MLISRIKKQQYNLNRYLYPNKLEFFSKADKAVTAGEGLQSEATGLAEDAKKQGLEAAGQLQKAGEDAVEQGKKTAEGLAQQGQQTLST